MPGPILVGMLEVSRLHLRVQKEVKTLNSREPFLLVLCRDSVGLWVSGRYCDQPGIPAWSPAHPVHQEALFPQSADLLHWSGHRDAFL